MKAAKHPQVTKIVRIILERCDGEETQSLNRTGTDCITKLSIDTAIEPQNKGASLFLLSQLDTATAEKTPSKESEESAGTSEEE